MNFGVAKFFGAIDKRFQDKYNYLIDLLSTTLSNIMKTPTFTGLITTAGQIKFPVTQNASTDANTLDDYEESTSFVPTVTAQTGAFTAVLANGRYIKIGKKVYYRFQVQITDKGTASGRIKITIPFQCAAGYNCGSGIEVDVTASPLHCFAVSTHMEISRYDGASMIVNGYNLIGNIEYESTI